MRLHGYPNLKYEADPSDGCPENGRKPSLPMRNLVWTVPKSAEHDENQFSSLKKQDKP